MTQKEAGLRLVALARESMIAHMHGGVVAAPPEIVEVFPYAAGVFVTIRKHTGELRGCIGTPRPVADHVVEEVIRNAPLAASSDPRFTPVAFDEMENLRLEVSVLTPPEPVEDVSTLDAQHYGVIVQDSLGRQALLLPAIPGIDTVERQLYEVRRKAGIHPEASVTIERFEVLKFAEPT